MKVCCVFSLESPHLGDSNEYTQYTIFNIKKKITLNYPKSAAMGFFFQGTQERVQNSHSKRAISVWAIEVLLYKLRDLCFACEKPLWLFIGQNIRCQVSRKILLWEVPVNQQIPKDATLLDRSFCSFLEQIPPSKNSSESKFFPPKYPYIRWETNAFQIRVICISTS